MIQGNVCKHKRTAAERVEAAGRLDPMCCGIYVLSQEPDFIEQKEWLIVSKFNIIFFPEYHCELNFIEMIWGWVKGHHRRTCTYNYEDLKKRLPETFIDVISLAVIRRAARYCFRFMDGYSTGLDGPLLDYSMKKYSSHRTTPSGIIESLDLEYAAHLEKKGNKVQNSKLSMDN